MRAGRNRIRSHREESGYSLTAFARLVGISPGWLSRIERGQGNPGPDVLRRIALRLKDESEARTAIAAITGEDKGSDERIHDG
ncbi:helix-turn-helix domain-containing protein [Streptomyces erythrochromogenes]|uniref:helix-turn-helix domain-containing protein n=1 Tax=Streptomyces erythrochromogenes TaxID=285574 RepID=UPI0037D5F602